MNDPHSVVVGSSLDVSPLPKPKAQIRRIACATAFAAALLLTASARATSPLTFRVLAVDGKHVTVSVGSDDGSQKGLMIIIFRGNRLLARARVERVEVERSVCVLLPGADAGVRVGDMASEMPTLVERDGHTPEPPAGDPAAGKTATVLLRLRLLDQFESLLRNPKTYAAKVAKECRRFPEGDLFPLVFPVYAYTNLAVSEPKEHRKRALERIPQLIDLILPVVARRVGAPDGDLLKLKTYAKHAVYLGHLNLALACYRRAGGDARYEKLHAHLCDLLHKALLAYRGWPLESSPTLSWPSDTVPCLLSLHLRDQFTGQKRSAAAIARHLTWLQRHATDPKLGLPYSRIRGPAGVVPVAPRGCVLTQRISMLYAIDPAYCRRLYRRFVRFYWREAGPLCGFAEWPPGVRGRQDVDSGPIFMGIGATATGFGISAAAACDDPKRHDRLCRQSLAARGILKMLVAAYPKQRDALTFGGLMDPDGPYVSGFLFGDACLFYAATWTNWTLPANPAPAADAAASPPRRNAPPPGEPRRSETPPGGSIRLR